MNKTNKNMPPGQKCRRWDIASTSAESSQTLDDATTSQRGEYKAEIPSELIELKLYARARVNLLYRRRSAFDDLLKKGELVNVQVLRNLLGSKITQYERRALEMCVLMLSLVQERLHLDHVDDICDVSIEVCSATAPEEMQYPRLREPVASMLVLSCIWTVEAAGGTNLAHLAYDLLFNIGVACANEHLQRYVEHLCEDPTKFAGEEVYWPLKLIHSALIGKRLNRTDTAKLFSTCVNIANRQDNTIYVNDIVADLLAAIWHDHPCDPTILPSQCRYNYMAKLLLAGLANEEMVSMLVTAAVSGSYSERKIALSALVRANNTCNISEIISKVTVPESPDLGILSVVATMLGDYDSAIVYLKRLYREIMRILNVGEVTDAEMMSKAQDGITNLVTREGNLSPETKMHVQSAGEMYFAIRDLLQAIIVTYQRMRILSGDLVTPKERKDEVDPQLDIEGHLLVVLYIATIREEFMPYVASVIDELICHIKLSAKSIRFCLQTIRSGGTCGIFFDQFMVAVCKLLLTIIKKWVPTYESLVATEQNAVNCLALEMVRSIRSVITACGSSLMKYRCSIHIASVFASLAVFMTAVPWGKATLTLSHEVSSAMAQLIRCHVLTDNGHRTNQSWNRGHIIYSHHEDALALTAAGFEMLCSAIVPPVKLIKMALLLVWHPKRASYVFRGFKTLVSTQHVGGSVISELIRYCLHAKVHTDWGDDTILSLRRMIKELLRLHKQRQSHSRKGNDRVVVSYEPNCGWKARRRYETRRTGRVKLYRGCNAAVFLRDFAMRLKEEAQTLSIANCRPVNLLDERLCVPKALMETKIHDCPGE